MAGGEDTPLLSSQAPEEFDAGKNLAMVGVLLTVPRLIGFGIAFGIYKLGATALYESMIKSLATKANFGWLFLAVYIFSVMVHWVNLFPMYYKGKVMKGDAGNLRANMFIYRLDDASHKHVVLEEEGGIGEYNRANRSLGHLVENAAGFVVLIPFAGYIFAFPTFVLIMIMAAGRVIHQMGYASGGYGKHAPGFMLHLISLVALEGLVLMAAIKLF